MNTISTGEYKTVIQRLKQLIEACQNGRKGFLEAAALVHDPMYRALLISYAYQRETFAEELTVTVEFLGGRPPKYDENGGLMYRAMLNLRALPGSERDQWARVLAECERAEDATRATYNEVMASEMPADLSIFIRRQAAQIERAHQHIRELRDVLQDSD